MIRSIAVLIAVLVLCSACVDRKAENGRGTGQASSPVSQPAAAETEARTDAELIKPEVNPCTDAPAANPCAKLGSGSGLRMRGLLSASADGLQFRPCGSQEQLPIQDNADGLLASQLTKLKADTGEIYVQLLGNSDGQSIVLEQLQRAASIDTALGCREDQHDLVYLARGNNPFWGTEVRSDGRLVLVLPSDDGSPEPRQIVYQYTGTEHNGKDIIINGVNPENQGKFSLTLRKEAMTDDVTGDWFGIRADMRYADVAHTGYAWPGEASSLPEIEPAADAAEQSGTAPGKS